MDFKNKLFLAPMAGFTDAPMRRLCRRLGCDAAVSEMISAKAMCFRDEKTGTLAKITEGEDACGIQLFGHEPESMARAAVMVAEGSFCGCSYGALPAFLDINMGCPVKKIVNSGDGSALMKNPRLAGKIVEACVRAVEEFKLPVTVKLRAGWDCNSINAPETAKILEASGASCITVHARTREQLYTPGVDLGVIKKVREALPADFPLVGNGDIKCAADAASMKEQTGCDSVMVGREALGNPWIFSEIKCFLEGREYTPPSIDERLAAALSLAREIIAEKGEARGVPEVRGRIGRFIKGLRGSSAVRDRLNHASTYAQIEEIILGGFFEQAGQPAETAVFDDTDNYG